MRIDTKNVYLPLQPSFAGAEQTKTQTDPAGRVPLRSSPGRSVFMSNLEFVACAPPAVNTAVMDHRMNSREIELSIRIMNNGSHALQGELQCTDKNWNSPFRSKQELIHLIENVTGSEDRDIAASHKLSVRCFGSFEVFWQGEPLLFRRKRTKELFAFLIDRECASCTAEEIAAALWEDSEDIQRSKSMIRNSIHDLKVTLRSIGMEDVLIRKRELIALRRGMIDCDYYRLLDGDTATAEQFSGRYMIQYSWAESTLGRIWFSEKQNLSVKHP